MSHGANSKDNVLAQCSEQYCIPTLTRLPKVALLKASPTKLLHEQSTHTIGVLRSELVGKFPDRLREANVPVVC